MERTYYEPRVMKEALALMAEQPGAAIVAGGTDLVVGDRSGKKPLPANIIAIHRLIELGRIDAAEDGGVRVGALVTHGELETSVMICDRYTALADAAALVGSPATRHVGTIGGNLCNGSPAMEVGSPLLVFEATIELASTTGGIRRVPLPHFVLGPAKTARRQDELLTAAVLPALPPGMIGSAYLRLETRQAMEIAIVGAAALLAIDEGGRCLKARVGLTAVAPTCVRAPGTESMLERQSLTSDLLTRAAAEAAAFAKPIDDIRGSAAYRQAMVPVIVRRALEVAWRRAKGEALTVSAAPGGEQPSMGGS